MKFTSFTGSFVGKLLLIILCLILGMVLGLGGLVLGVYIVLTKDGMVGTVTDFAGDKLGQEIELDDEIKAMSVLGWVQEIVGTVSDLGGSTIGDIEKIIGINLISETIEDMIGLDAAKAKASKLEDLGKAISENMTVGVIKDKFGISFPDMPLFENTEFLSSPLSTAFADFDKFTLGEILTIDENSNTVLQQLKDVAIKDIGAASTDSTIKGMLLCELMTITDDSNMTLKALKYSCIESQYELDGSGNILLDEEDKPVYKTKTIKENGVSKTVELIGINETIDSLCVKDVVEIGEDGAVVLRKMRQPTEEEIAAGKADLFGTEDLLIKDLGGEKVQKIIDATKLGELITIYEDDVYDEDGVTLLHKKSEPILVAIKDDTVSTLSDHIGVMTLSELFKAEDLASGALSLISPETKINEIPAAMTAVMTNCTTATLVGKGLIEESDLSGIGGLHLEQQAFIYNSNVGGMMNKIIEFIQHPIDSTQIALDPMHPENAINYHYIAPNATTVNTASYASISAFVADYNQYDSVTFAVAVTVDIDATADADYYDEATDTYLIPIFNAESGTVAFNGGTVKLAVFDADGVSRNQYGFRYAKAGATVIDVAYVTLIAKNE